MPVITVQLLSGRTAAQKKAFIQEMATVAMRTLDVPERAVTIVLTEIEPDNWGAGTKTISQIRSESPA